MNPVKVSFNHVGAVNILNDKEGARGIAKQVQIPLESFNLFFTDEMLKKIVTCTKFHRTSHGKIFKSLQRN